MERGFFVIVDDDSVLRIGQNIIKYGEKFINLERLCERAPGTESSCEFYETLWRDKIVVPAGHGNDSNPRKLGTQLPNSSHALLPGHEDICQHDIRLLAPLHFYARMAIGRFKYFMPGIFQNFSNRLPHGLMVVNN
jgi:hypothetical protein